MKIFNHPEFFGISPIAIITNLHFKSPIFEQKLELTNTICRRN